MPTHIRATCAWQINSMLPRDAQVINPCFRHQSILVEGGPEWQTLADDLAAGLYGWATAPTNHQLEVKLYEIKDPVAGEPNRPRATKKMQADTAQPAYHPSEVALCLSFHGGNNSPRERGRLYLPASKFTTTQLAARPSTPMMQKVGDLVPIFAGLGGVNVDWIVWSPTRKAATKVTSWHVDDEWDTVRKRGLRPVTRVSGSTGG